MFRSLRKQIFYGCWEFFFCFIGLLGMLYKKSLYYLGFNYIIILIDYIKLCNKSIYKFEIIQIFKYTIKNIITE